MAVAHIPTQGKARVFSFLVRALAPVAPLMNTASLCDPAAASCTADKVYAKTYKVEKGT